ncbi:MAG: hypothetical protein VW935_16290 [Novosphingobium sp.]|mgnify:CR=1 FL=1|jgi:hypothetical protein|uniref:hypothetical protein n=1 Tax=Sphingomonas sp. ABOLE TaxID=1985878 RepID=UPI000F7EB640|nr:hypothetical protein [Sphingomonas sp. ABOLE]RSV41782.1 hypothetical protein CA234_08905 [Sphingomonas sp. ABOLE]
MATIIDKVRMADDERSARAFPWRAVLHFMLHGSGVVGSTLLITWGLFFLFFLLLGDLSFDGLVHQLHNFTSRYVAADVARTAAFQHTFAIAHLILSSAIILLRRDKLLPRRREEGAGRRG